MSQLLAFPQRQHQEFRRLVFRAVLDAARKCSVSVEEYITGIYHAGENPPLFSSVDNRRVIYRRFRNLIEQAVCAEKDAESLSVCEKVYLCFRIYLHSLCMERKSLPGSEAEIYLSDALKEYFESADRLLCAQDEIRILRYLKRLRLQARALPR